MTMTNKQWRSYHLFSKKIYGASRVLKANVVAAAQGHRPLEAQDKDSALIHSRRDLTKMIIISIFE